MMMMDFGAKGRRFESWLRTKISKKCISERLKHVATWYHGPADRSSPNSGNVSIGQTHPWQISSHSAKRCTRKALQKFYTLHYFGTPGESLGQTSPISVVMYMKAPSIKVPNFVPFWKPVYELAAAKVRRFRRRRDPHTQKKTVNDMSPHTMRR